MKLHIAYSRKPYPALTVHMQVHIILGLGYLNLTKIQLQINYQFLGHLVYPRIFAFLYLLWEMD